MHGTDAPQKQYIHPMPPHASPFLTTLLENSLHYRHAKEKKNNSPRPSHFPSPSIPVPQPVLANPTRTYANVLTGSNNLHLIEQPAHFPHPIWKSYTDENPWTTILLSPDGRSKDHPTPLPLPPNPAHPEWRGRCYNCLSLGHEQNDCTCKERVCAKCWVTGTRPRCVLLQRPQSHRLSIHSSPGNIGDSKMPNNRPKKVMVFVPATIAMQQDKSEMARAIVIDARLRAKHNLNILQSILMATCATPFPFPLTKLNNTQYLQQLPPGIDREVFL